MSVPGCVYLPAGGLLSPDQCSKEVFSLGSVSGACLGPTVSSAGSCVTRPSPSLGKSSGLWLRWHWDLLAPGTGSLKSTLLPADVQPGLGPFSDRRPLE